MKLLGAPWLRFANDRSGSDPTDAIGRIESVRAFSLPTAEDDAAGGLQIAGDSVIVESLSDCFLIMLRAVSVRDFQRAGSGMGCAACRTVNDRMSAVTKVEDGVMSAAATEYGDDNG
jgi:hypothetical protein